VHFTRIGDDWMAQRSEAAADALARFAPNPPHHLFAQSHVDEKVYARIPVRTQLFVTGDSLEAGLRAALVEKLGDAASGGGLQAGDIVAVSEKAVAICKGRSFPVEDVRVRPLGRDTAIVAYKVHEELDVEGKPVSLDASDSSVWVKRDGAWKCALHTESLKGDPFGRDKSDA